MNAHSNGSTRRIAVAGGTGLVGSKVVAEVRRAGATPVVVARSAGIDLETGAGLEEALAGVDAVIDTSNVETMSAKRSIAFFETASRRLLEVGARAGVRHHVALSIVGCSTEQITSRGPPAPWIASLMMVFGRSSDR